MQYKDTKYLHVTAISVAIFMLLTATVFAVPNHDNISSTEVNNAIKLQNDGNRSSGLVNTVLASSGNNHDITLEAVKLYNDLLAYRMVSHIVNFENGTSEDITGNYDSDASIPGPTIIIKEGDTVDLTVVNSIGEGEVSVHVHGVHYQINSDGTLIEINGVSDQGATPGNPVTMHWTAGPGTAGTWPYHDHTFGSKNGAENRGLFGMLIVNPADDKVQAVDNNKIKTIDVDDIAKEFVLYIGDDAFWGMEIDNSNGKQTPLWTNPLLGAKTGDYVRFHLIALGTDPVHLFTLSKYKWLEPGTNYLIRQKPIGPLEHHVFTIKVKQGMSLYMDNTFSNKLMGMQGKLRVTNSGANSIPSPIPDPF